MRAAGTTSAEAAAAARAEAAEVSEEDGDAVANAAFLDWSATLPIDDLDSGVQPPANRTSSPEQDGAENESTGAGAEASATSQTLPAEVDKETVSGAVVFVGAISADSRIEIAFGGVWVGGLVGPKLSEASVKSPGIYIGFDDGDVIEHSLNELRSLYDDSLLRMMEPAAYERGRIRAPVRAAKRASRSAQRMIRLVRTVFQSRHKRRPQTRQLEQLHLSTLSPRAAALKLHMLTNG